MECYIFNTPPIVYPYKFVYGRNSVPLTKGYSMSDKKPSRYAASPEFLASCLNAGIAVGHVTGKAEFAIAKTTYVTVQGAAVATKGLFIGHKATR